MIDPWDFEHERAERDWKRLWRDRDPWEIPPQHRQKYKSRPDSNPSEELLRDLEKKLLAHQQEDTQREQSPPSIREEKNAAGSASASRAAGALPRTTPPVRAGVGKSRRTRGEGWKWVSFLLFLALIVCITTALVVFQTVKDSQQAVENRPYPSVSYPPTPSRQPVTVERAPVGDGTTLTIVPAPDRTPLTFQEIYQKVIPSIVSIRGVQNEGGSLGTGVVAASNGYIVTNSHVIEGCSKVSVILQDDSTYPARLVGNDADSDLAVLKIEAEDLIPASFGDSSVLQVGDVALAIGNPLGERLRGTMTDGIISAINRDMTVNGKDMVLIQTTAALNSGNSGGALLNTYGQVVGITNMKMSSEYHTVEGLGFAIPSATVKEIADELIAFGFIGGRPTIGITVRAVPPDGELLLAGVRVEAVEKKSDAWTQGVREGDIIVSANGTPTPDGSALNAVKETLGVGDTITLRIYRDGDYLEISVRLVERHDLEDG